jgi:predicted N-acetyltransferase YhbS
MPPHADVQLQRYFWRDSVREVVSPEDRAAVERLRYQVYVREMGKPYPGANHVDRRLADDLDNRSVILAARADGRIVGSLRCTRVSPDDPYGPGLRLDLWPDAPSANALVCSRFVVERRWRHTRRIGLALMGAIYHWARDHDVQLCFCSTGLSLVPFFERFGFRPYGPPFVDADTGRPQRPLCLVLEDVEHLVRVRSPFLIEASQRPNRAPQDAWVARFLDRAVRHEPSRLGDQNADIARQPSLDIVGIL